MNSNLHPKSRPLALAARGARLSLLGAAAACGVACGEPIKSGQVLEETRVLAVQVESEQSSATLHSDSGGSVRVLIAGTRGPTRTNTALRLCEAVESSRGVPACLHAPFAEAELLDVIEPAVAFSTAQDVAERQKWALLGVACEEGKPVLADDPLDDRCEGGGAPLRFSFESRFAGSEPDNLNPELSGTQVHVLEPDADELEQGTELPTRSADAAAECNGLPAFEAGQSVVLRVALPESAREAEEELQLSHFATAGKLKRQFSIVSASESLVVELEYELPEQAAAVKHYVVVRDGRGGVGFVSFDFCVSDMP